MKRTRRLLCLLSLSLTLVSGAFGVDETPEYRFYAAWNPAASLSFFPMGFVVRSILPTALAYQEAGVAVAFGYEWNSQAAEARLSLGNSNSYDFVAQVQVGWNVFFGELAGWTNKGPYAGAALRYWDLIQLQSGMQSHNVSPMINLGWCFDFGRWFIDLRLSQIFAVASFSSVPHSTPGFAFTFSPLPAISPILPLGLVQVGLRF